MIKDFRARWSYRFEMLLVYLTNHVISRIVLSSVRLFWFRRIMGFEIGPGSSILTDFKVSRRGNLKLGRSCVVNNSCRFDNRFLIELDDNVSITYGTMILTKGHDIDSPTFATKGGGVKIGSYAWVCAQAIILPGVTLGQGAVALTGAVVTRDVAPFQVVGGNPAQLVRERPQNQAYVLKWDPWVPFFG